MPLPRRVRDFPVCPSGRSFPPPPHPIPASWRPFHSLTRVQLKVSDSRRSPAGAALPCGLKARGRPAPTAGTWESEGPLPSASSPGPGRCVSSFLRDWLAPRESAPGSFGAWLGGGRGRGVARTRATRGCSVSSASAPHALSPRVGPPCASAGSAIPAAVSGESSRSFSPAGLAELVCGSPCCQGTSPREVPGQLLCPAPWRDAPRTVCRLLWVLLLLQVSGSP